MATKWRETTLGEVVELKRGYDLPRRDRLPGKVPLVSSSGVTDSHAVAKVKGPGVVTGRYGTLGEVFFVRDDFWPLNTTLYVRDFKGNDPLFISYFLRTLDYLAYSDKAAVPGVNRNDLHTARVRLPWDVEEQRSIGQILGTLDEKIELNREMNETLEGVAKTLFKSWFLDFDPVGDNAAGRLTSTPTAVADLFPDSLDESELGAIPKGWRVTTVDRAFRLTMGQSPPGDSYNRLGVGVPFFQGNADFTARFPKRRMFCTAPKRFAAPGDTLISVRAPVGAINMAAERCCIGRGLAAARHRSGSRSYTYYFMKSQPEVFARFEAGGTVFGSINKQDFLSLRCLEVPTSVIAQFEKYVSALDARIAHNEAATATLRALRDALLPKLLSGELRTAEAERVAQGHI